jgi:hypothetical protein
VQSYDTLEIYVAYHVQQRRAEAAGERLVLEARLSHPPVNGLWSALWSRVTRLPLCSGDRAVRSGEISR